MKIKYCESDTTNVSIANIDKATVMRVKDEDGDPMYVCSCAIAGGFDLVHIETLTYDKALDLLNTLYETGNLDVSSDADCTVVTTMGPFQMGLTAMFNPFALSDDDEDEDIDEELDDEAGIDFSSFY